MICRLAFSWKGGGPCGPAAVKVVLLLAGAFGAASACCMLFRHFSFDRVKIENSRALHWRVIKEGLECLAHYLLDEYKAPELEFEPIEVCCPPSFRPMIWPALALERIERKLMR